MNMKLVDEIFSDFTQSGSPGCAVAVVQNGKIVFRKGYGLANIENEVPITPKSVFNIGSMAKQFTAFAILLLESEGRLTLDDDIRKHLPELPDFGQVVTIRHLVHHTSGMRNSFPALLSLAEWRDIDATSTQDVFKLLKMQRNLNFVSGEQHEYSNSNYILMALIVAKVSEKSFSEFMHANVFAPLGMLDTVISDSFFKLIPNRALGHYDDDGKYFYAPLTDTVIGSTNVYTNVLDLARWDQNFYTCGVGGEKVIEQMHQCGILNDGSILDYAFGLTTGPTHQHRGWAIVEHGGSHGGYSSHMIRFSEAKLSVIVLFNTFHWGSRDYALKVADLFLEDHEGFQPEEEQEPQQILSTIKVTDEQMAEKTGTYFSDAQLAIREVSFKEGKLYFNQYLLLPISEKLFYFEVQPGTKIAFTSADEHHAASIKTITPSGEYSYRKVEVVSAKEINLDAYAGKYYSDELDIYWNVILEAEGLKVVRRKYPASQLSLLFMDTFTDDWGPLLGYPTTYTLQFQRDGSKRINGLTVSGSGVRNLIFKRC